MVWGIFSVHTLGPLAPIEHRLNAKAYLSIVADHVHPFMTTVYLSSDGYFQQDNAPCHKVQIISDWFLEHDNEFTLLKWSPQSPDLNPIEHLWDVVEREIHIMDVQPTNLNDAIMSIWTKISEECLQHLVESMPRRIKAVLKAKGGPTRYKQDVPNKLASECIYLTLNSFTLVKNKHTKMDLKYIYFMLSILQIHWHIYVLKKIALLVY